MKLFLLSFIFMLGGCAGQTAVNQTNAKVNAELDSWKRVQSISKIRCGDRDVIKQGEAVEVQRCHKKVADEYVLPTAVHPDVYVYYSAKALELADSYDKGQITSAQYQVQRSKDWIDYLNASDAKSQAYVGNAMMQDQLYRQNMQNYALQQQQVQAQQQQMQTTNCQMVGHMMNCQTF